MMIRIGTRKSPLALKQTEIFVEKLKTVYEGDIEIIPLSTTGDQIQDRSLASLGGKGLFAKEIEMALLEKKIDCGVHSLKDMETTLPEGLILGAVLEREDSRDAFLSREGKRLEELPSGAKVGTCSPRRTAQVLAKRSDLTIVMARGNVQTRLKKLDSGEYDATVMAFAGLKRLGLEHLPVTVFSIQEMIPAACQGIIGIECRADDFFLKDVLQKLNHPDSWSVSQAERQFLHAMGGNCRTPIGAHATIDHRKDITLKSWISTLDAQKVLVEEERGRDPVGVAQNLAKRLREKSSSFWEECQKECVA
jgi:hydroxymethylbilane synthase